MGLALSLARIPPRLPRFRPLSHRLRRRLVRVASVGEAAVSRFGFRSRSRFGFTSFSAASGESWCLYALPISKSFGDHRCVLERIPYELAVNRQYLRRTNDIKRHKSTDFGTRSGPLHPITLPSWILLLA